MKQKSLFDVISPIMTGPSSSHTAGAVRIGLLARSIYKNPIKKVKIRLYNSFAGTGKGHGTDRAILAGLLGYGVDSEKIKNIQEYAKGIEYTYEKEENTDRHPNSADIEFYGDINMKISGNSVGAGNVEIIKIDDFTTKISGEYNTIILFYKDKPGMLSRVTGIIQEENINIASLECDRNARGQTASMIISIDGAITDDVTDKIKKTDDVYLVRYVNKLED